MIEVSSNNKTFKITKALYESIKANDEHILDEAGKKRNNKKFKTYNAINTNNTNNVNNAANANNTNNGIKQEELDILSKFAEQIYSDLKNTNKLNMFNQFGKSVDEVLDIIKNYLAKFNEKSLKDSWYEYNKNENFKTKFIDTLLSNSSHLQDVMNIYVKYLKYLKDNIYPNIVNEFQNNNIMNNVDSSAGTTIKRQEAFIERFKQYIKEAMKSMGYFYGEYLFSSGKTKFSPAYDKTEDNNERFFDNIYLKVVSDKIYPKISKSVKEKLEAYSANLEEQEKNAYNVFVTRTLNLLKNNFNNVLNNVMHGKLLDKTPDNKDSLEQEHNILIYNMLIDIFYINKELSTCGKSVYNVMKNDDSLTKSAENLFYFNVICFNEDCFEDLCNFMTSRTTLKSGTNKEKELYFKQLYVTRVKHVDIRSIQIFSRNTNTNKNTQIAHMDIVYSLSQFKPFVKNLSSLLGGITKTFGSHK